MSLMDQFKPEDRREMIRLGHELAEKEHAALLARKIIDGEDVDEVDIEEAEGMVKAYRHLQLRYGERR